MKKILTILSVFVLLSMNTIAYANSDIENEGFTFGALNTNEGDFANVYLVVGNNTEETLSGKLFYTLDVPAEDFYYYDAEFTKEQQAFINKDLVNGYVAYYEMPDHSSESFRLFFDHAKLPEDKSVEVKYYFMPIDFEYDPNVLNELTQDELWESLGVEPNIMVIPSEDLADDIGSTEEDNYIDNTNDDKGVDEGTVKVENEVAEQTKASISPKTILFGVGGLAGIAGAFLLLTNKKKNQ